jgi:hypothetical protein
MIDETQKVTINRFVFYMKALAENDLWDEASYALEEHGVTHLTLETKHLAIIRQMVAKKVAAGESLTAKGKIIPECLSCGGMPQPKPPPGGGGDGGVGPPKQQ